MRRDRSLVVASFAFGVLAAACSKRSSATAAPAPKGWSCNEVKAGICTEYAEAAPVNAASTCKQMFSGTYGKACPTDNALGFCTTDHGDKQYYYVGNGWAAWVEDARKDCEEGVFTRGKFTAATTANIEQLAKDHAIPTADHIVASCVHKDGSCDDVVGRMEDLAKKFCVDDGGTFGTAACSTDALVGSCVKHGQVSRFYATNLKTSTVKQLTDDCEARLIGGHWYPGPAAPKEPTPNAAAVKRKKNEM